MAEKDNKHNTQTEASPKKRAESGVDIEVVLFNILRNWWIILICCVIAAMCAYIAVSERYKPTYYAEATFVVSSKDGSSDTLYT
nr:hypothetical protein [Clostridiales bacterium]